MHPSSFLSVLAILLPLASARPADPLAPRFAPGWCTFHITQHQRNEKDVNSGNDYHYDLRILDSAQAEIGRTIGLAIPDLEARSATSNVTPTPPPLSPTTKTRNIHLLSSLPPPQSFPKNRIYLETHN
ncbi:hypothetical protein Q9189_004071 [Teloschistes chrysophthalmus]